MYRLQDKPAEALTVYEVRVHVVQGELLFPRRMGGHNEQALALLY